MGDIMIIKAIIQSLINIFSNNVYKNFLKVHKNINVKNDLKIFGMPLINIHKNAKLIIGENVTINSDKYNYHISMHSPVKIVADVEKAEIIIGKNSRINGACIHSKEKIIIGKNVLIAANTQIFDNNGHNISFDNVSNRINTKGISKPVHIEDNVWIGANSIILPGVKIGEGSIIAAGSIIKTDVPKMTIFSEYI